MIHGVSQKLAYYLLSKGIIKENEIDIYVYGYETLISGIIDFLLTLTLGIIFNRPYSSLIYFAMFVSVRMYTGGYHADSYLKCKIIFVFSTIVVLGISYIEFALYVEIMIIVLFMITVFYLSPIENPNKPLSTFQKRKYRIIALLCSLFWSVAAIIAYFYIKYLSVTIVGTAFIIALMMIIGVYRKEEQDNEKE